jgi:hypothetical protein
MFLKRRVYPVTAVFPRSSMTQGTAYAFYGSNFFLRTGDLHAENQVMRADEGVCAIMET